MTLERPAGPHGQRRLDIEIAFGQALAGLIDGIAGGTLQDAQQIALLSGAEACLAADSEQAGEHDALDQLPGVEIDLVFQTGIAFIVGGGQIVDDDGRTVGQDHAVPDDERPLLSVGHDGIIFSEQARPLRNEQVV